MTVSPTAQAAVAAEAAESLGAPMAYQLVTAVREDPRIPMSPAVGAEEERERTV